MQKWSGRQVFAGVCLIASLVLLAHMQVLPALICFILFTIILD